MGRSKFLLLLQCYFLVLFALYKNAKIQHYLSIKSQKCHPFSQSSSSTNWSIPKSATLLNLGSVALSGILQIFHLELDDCTLGHKYSYLYYTVDTEDICTALQTLRTLRTSVLLHICTALRTLRTSVLHCGH